MCVFIRPTSWAFSPTSGGQVASRSYSQATLRISFSAKLCASSRRSFCSSVRVKSTNLRAPSRRDAGRACVWPAIDQSIGSVLKRLLKSARAKLRAMDFGTALVLIVLAVLPVSAVLFVGAFRLLDQLGKGGLSTLDRAPVAPGSLSARPA